MTTRRSLPTIGLAAAALILAACSDTPTRVLAPATVEQHLIPAGSPELELLVLCKSGPVGTYTFGVTATHPVLWNSATNSYNLSNATYSITVNLGSTIGVGGATVPGACATFTNTNTGMTHNHIGLAGGATDAYATVVETGIPDGTVFDHVETYQNIGATVSSTSSLVNSATGRLGGDGNVLTGATIVFYNRTIPVVYYGNSINVQTVRISPTLTGDYVTGFSGSFLITAFDKAVTVTGLQFKISKNGEQAFWQGSCPTSPPTPFNVDKSSVVTVTILGGCAVGGSPQFKSGDDVRLEVVATLATGRVFKNSGFYKIP